MPASPALPAEPPLLVPATPLPPGALPPVLEPACPAGPLLPLVPAVPPDPPGPHAAIPTIATAETALIQCERDLIPR
jgi:hypothetical protein